MGFSLKNGVAISMAISLMGTFLSVAQAQELTLPQVSADPVVLHLASGAPNEEMLRVFVEGAETPIAGHYTIAGDTLQFSTAFGFEPGEDYVAQVLMDGEAAEFSFRLPDLGSAVPAAVTGIFPSGGELPENTLRFYIHFSTPMQPHVAFDHIRLMDASGDIDEAAFMRFKQEIWNEDRTRLTVLIDPGRIKREVATNLELGPALLEGQTYTLSVEPGWRSADGQTALDGFSKTFLATAPLRDLPDIAAWDVSLPCQGTMEPMVLTFDRPFDRHLLERGIHVLSGAEQIAGAITVGPDEQSLSFVPDTIWTGPEVQIIADPTLEDVAGNNFQDLLDHIEGDDAPRGDIPALGVALPLCSE